LILYLLLRTGTQKNSVTKKVAEVMRMVWMEIIQTVINCFIQER